jgi:RNA polymerase sigma factor (sigma-70 family)
VLDAENCFQDALLKILCMEPYSDRISKPATWFYTVLKNTVIDYISLKRIYMEDIDGLSSDIFTDETNAGDSYSYWKSLFNTVSKKTLNKTEQTIFKFLMQGWAYEDIAAELGRTEGYIKTAVRRAKQKIGDFIKNPANSPYLINIA